MNEEKLKADIQSILNSVRNISIYSAGWNGGSMITMEVKHDYFSYVKELINNNADVMISESIENMYASGEQQPIMYIISVKAQPIVAQILGFEMSLIEKKRKNNLSRNKFIKPTYEFMEEI
jgi:hypothetical protein